MTCILSRLSAEKWTISLKIGRKTLASHKISGLPRAWPRVNISETDKELRITAELPGVEQKDIDITLTGGDLVIKGEKKSESEEKKDDKGRSYHRAERSFGSFARRMALPFEVEAGKIDATFKDGVLTLVLPKPAEAQKASRKIEIKSEKAIEPRKAA